MINIVHGFMLTLSNLGAVIFGYGIYYLTGKTNQLAIQLPVSILMSYVFFALWVLAATKVSFLRNYYSAVSDYFKIYIFSMISTPIIFIPLHLITQGYITSFENVLSIWIFQSITNIIVIFLAKKSLFNN